MVSQIASRSFHPSACWGTSMQIKQKAEIQLRCLALPFSVFQPVAELESWSWRPHNQTQCTESALNHNSKWRVSQHLTGMIHYTTKTKAAHQGMQHCMDKDKFHLWSWEVARVVHVSGSLGEQPTQGIHWQQLSAALLLSGTNAQSVGEEFSHKIWNQRLHYAGHNCG
jgi:hypothetical protein